MKLTKQELKEELTHRYKLIRAYRGRLRPLEIQAAQRGLNAPPEVLTEISTLTEQISIQESEITELETQYAEENLSLAEAEYRLQLADGLDKSDGRLSYVDIASLELARLKLRLQSERAKELENEIRSHLAEDTIIQLPSDFLLIYSEGLKNAKSYVKSIMQQELKSPLEAMKMNIGHLHSLEESARIRKKTGSPIPAHSSMEIQDVRSKLVDEIYRIEGGNILNRNDPLDEIAKQVWQIEQKINESSEELGFEMNIDWLIKQLSKSFKKEFKLLERSIRLDYETTAQLLLGRMPGDVGFEVNIFVQTMLNGLDLQQPDRNVFDLFYERLSNLEFERTGKTLES